MSRDNFNPEKTPGNFEAPPAEAPRETSQPISDSTLTDALNKARENEQPLAPFNPQPAGERRMGVDPPKAMHAAPKERPPVQHQPAASSSDSPSRGVPREIGDPGKTITGGFGHAGEAQYFPLSGDELREMVYGLMDAMHARLQNDLRFHIAVVYPRIRVRLAVEVEAYAQDGFTVEKIAVHEKTPMEFARAVADHVAFAVIEERRETDDAGNAEHPPDRMRDELGLPKPHKQTIQTPGGPMVVDQKPSLENAF